ncbi:aldehyde dehydrogenase family protein [Nocardioides sp. NPDC087217]|uniref:aldehyde dehydrogenase family protein n=1 Tax=Nocardioides sp. NPDC087217 TaxID=3364335 RepID=UPI00380F2AF6
MSLDSRSPADGALVASFPVMAEDEVRAVVATAHAASTWWRDLGFDGRAVRLAAWRKHMWRRVDEIAELLHRENGKPLDDAVLEVVLTVEHLHWAARNAGRVLRSHKVNPGPLFSNYGARVDYDPLGVVGVIGPWNYPLYAPNSAVAFALAAGNTVVLKPSEFTPAVSRWYVDAFAEANPDAPEGVLSLVTGFGETGAALCNAGVDKIGFTGSTHTGKRVMAQCAETLTPVVLECGGKDPVIVAADADVVAAARAVAWGAFTNSGQTCVGVERVYVVDEVADEFESALLRELKEVRPGSDAGATYGPMTMPAQVDVVRRHVVDAVARGARFLKGGPESIGDRLIEPIVITDLPEDAAAVREETFGPTVTLRRCVDVDEAITLANDHDYALSASVFSRAQGEEIADRLRAGQITVNSVIAFAGMGAVPMGGVGASGFGRVHGADGLREFARPRGVVRQRFALPGFELITLRRAGHVMPLMKKVLSVRHGR